MRKPGLDSTLEDVSGEIQERLLVLLLRATHSQRTKLRGPNATRQPRTQEGELVQNSQIGELGCPRISQLAGYVHDTSLQHGTPHAKLDDTGEAPASGFVRVYKPPNEDVFEDLEDNYCHLEHIEEHESIPLEAMNYYNDRTPREGTQTEFQRRYHFDPVDIDGDDSMEDDIQYTTMEYGPSHQHDLLVPDETYQQTLRETAQGFRSGYPRPDDMGHNEQLFEDGEYYLCDEEKYVQYQADDTHMTDLVADTLPYSAGVFGGYDDETACLEEGRQNSRWVSEDNSVEYREANEAFEYAVLRYENAGDHLHQPGAQDQYEGDFYEGPYEDYGYIPPEDRTQVELHDEGMCIMSVVNMEIRGDHSIESDENIYDYRIGSVDLYGSEYTYQYDPADDNEAEAIYGRPGRYSHGSDQIPRIYPYPRPGSMGIDQAAAETQYSQGDTLDFGVTHDRDSQWNGMSGTQ